MASIFHFPVYFMDSLARVLVEALLNSLWQGLLIAALVWLLLRVTARASATTRHAVWFVSLSAILLLPVFTGVKAWRKSHASVAPVTITQAKPLVTTSLPLIAYQTSVPKVAQASSLCCLPSANTGAVVSSLAPVIPSAPATDFNPASRATNVKALPLAGRLPLLLAALWLLGSALMLTRFARSYHALVRLRRTLTDVPVDIDARMQWLANVFGIRRVLRVTASPEAKMPMTVGWRAPLIILPHDLSQTLTSAECDSVLAHELAHIKRHDYATNFAQRLAQCLFFFHPAVWFISQQLVIERELACDDWAVKLTGEPRRYAGCLTKLVELLSESKPLLAATGILFGKHIITRRVEMILNRDRNATTSISKPALAYAIALATICVAICSSLSPVIAVPLAQRPPAPAPKPAVPKTPKVAMPAPAPAPVVSGDILELDAPLARIEINGEPIVVPSPAEWDELNEHIRDLQDQLPALAPLAPMAPISPISPLAPLAELDAWRSNADNLFGQQSSEKKAPAIPEDEMLKLLTDIVKRDADANVRAEALSGIYRLRSDNAINTLIQLYDQVTDVKTKGDILARLIRRTGDNSKAVAKLVQVVKTEKDETLVSRALNSLGYLKGDEGADQLVSIYDGLADPKMKQRVIRSLSANRSKKAIEKLMAIAKSDSDPTLRQAALRSLSNLDGDSFNFSTGIARDGAFNFNFDGKTFEIDQERVQEMKRNAEERAREAEDRIRESQERIRERMIERKSGRTSPDGTSTDSVKPAPAAGKKSSSVSPQAAPKAATASGSVI